MGHKAKHFWIAVSIMILDLVVTVRYGVVVWRPFSGIIWARITLISLTALWATTLLDLWSRVYYEFRIAVEAEAQRLSPRLVTAPAELRKDSDV